MSHSTLSKPLWEVEEIPLTPPEVDEALKGLLDVGSIVSRIQSVLDAIKPVTLISTLLNLFSDVSAVEYGRDISILAELYSSKIPYAWEAISMALVSIKIKMENQTPEEKAEAKADADEGVSSRMAKLGRDAIDSVKEGIKFHSGIVVPEVSDLFSLLKIMWEAGKTFMISGVASLLTALTTIASIFPEIKWVKRCNDRFMAYLTNTLKIRNAVPDHHLMCSALDKALQETFGDAEANPIIEKSEWARQIQKELERSPAIIYHPGFPMDEIKKFIKDLEEKAHREKNAYGQWAQRRADELKTISDRYHQSRHEGYTRPVPVCVVIAGEPGVGKTTFIKALAEEVNKVFGTKGHDAWQAGLDHHDEVIGKPVMTFEEFGYRDLPGDQSCLQRLVDSNQFVSDNDKLENKARREAPAVVLVSTNQENIYKGFKFHDALARRVDYHVHMSNHELAQFAQKNPNVPLDNKTRADIVAKNQSLMALLPSGSVDWKGTYSLSGKVQTSPPAFLLQSKLISDVVKDVKSRWDSILNGNFDIAFHATDAVVFCLTGTPGTGKTSMAGRVMGARVFDDPWVDDDSWDRMVQAVMRAEETGDKIIITTNLEPWKKQIAKMPDEERAALSRRIDFMNFSFQRRNWFQDYTVDDIPLLGWSTCVSVRYRDQELSYTQALDLMNTREAKAKEGSPTKLVIHTTAYPMAAETNLTMQQVIKNASPTTLICNFNIHAVPGLSPSAVLKDIFLGPGKIKTAVLHTVDSAILALMDAKRKIDVPPVSIRFADGCVNFWTDTKTGFIRCAKVVSPESTDDVPVFPKCGQTVSATIGQVCMLAASVVNTLGGIVCASMAMRYRFHSPTDEDLQADHQAKGRRDNVSPKVLNRDRLNWEENRTNSWAEDNGVMDYEATVRFDSMKTYILPCADAFGNHVGWGFSTKAGILMNRHVRELTAKIGTRSVGDSVVEILRGTDLALVRPKKDPGYAKSGIPFSKPAIGEMIYQFGPEKANPLQSGRVRKTRDITGRNGGVVRVVLCDAAKSEEGDCGLPWVRKVGDSFELVGLHTGVCSGMVMITLVHDVPSFHGGKSRNATSIYRSQFYGVQDCVEDMKPSDKVWAEEPGEEATAAGMTRHVLKPFFPADERDNSVPEECVEAAIDYLQTFVPREETRSWSVNATVRSLDMKTSAGPSYNAIKSSVFDEDGSPFPEYAKQFWYGLKGAPDGTCHVSVKDELRPPSKISTGSSRPIFVFDVHATVAVKRFVGAGMTKLAETAGEHIWGPGISFLGGGWAMMAERMKRKKYTLDADFAKWDSTNTHALVRQAIHVMSHLAPEGNRSEVEAWWLALMEACTQHGRIRTGLPSGVVGTALLNCTSHLLTLNAILLKSNRAMIGELGCPVEVIAYGDDILVAFDDIRIEKILVDGWRERGFVATNAKKTGPPMVAPMSELSFLKRRIVKIDGEWRAPLEPKSIWRALSFMRSHVQYDHSGGLRDSELVGTRLRNVLQGVFSEFWQHGQAVYDDALVTLVTFMKLRKQRLPFAVPPYKRFRPRDVLLDDGAFDWESSVKILSVLWHGDDRREEVSMAPSPGGEAVGTVVGMPGLSTGLAAPTAGIETATAVSGGPNVMMDPAIRERFVIIPGGTVSVRTNMTPGTIIYQRSVEPGINPWTGLLANMYNAWCGGFEIMVVVGANNFIGGKLMAVYTPPNRDPNKYSVEQLTGFPHAILDIRMMDNVMLECSDIKYVLWHPTNGTGIISMAGTFSLWLLTNIVTAGNAGVELNLDIRLFSRPAPNFDFNLLIPPVLGQGNETLDTWFQSQGSLLATPTSGCGTNSPLRDILVVPVDKSIVSGGMWGTTVAVNGYSPLCFSAASATSVMCSFKTTVGPETASNIILYDKTGPWDINAAGDGSKSLPPNFIAFAPVADNMCVISFPQNATLTYVIGKLTFTGLFTNPQFTPVKTSIAILAGTNCTLSWIPCPTKAYYKHKNAPADVPDWVPPNGESLLVYTAFMNSISNGGSLTTQPAAGMRVIDPKVMAANTAALYNMSDRSGTTTVQAKMYPNGVMTTGTSSTTILYTGPVRFVFVGVVSYEYKLNPPLGGNAMVEVQELVSSLSEWLLQQRLPDQHLSAELSQERSGLDRLLKEQLGRLKPSRETKHFG